MKRHWRMIVLSGMLALLVAAIAPAFQRPTVTNCGEAMKPRRPLSIVEPTASLAKRILEQSEIEAAAINAVKILPGNDTVEIEAVSSYRDGSEWKVSVWLLPAAPGNENYVVVSETGEIKEIQLGK